LSFGVVPELSLRQRLRLRVSGCVFLCWVDGGKGPLPLYVVKCVKHGLFLDTPHGYGGKFDCRDCEVEAKMKKVEVC